MRACTRFNTRLQNFYKNPKPNIQAPMEEVKQHKQGQAPAPALQF